MNAIVSEASVSGPLSPEQRAMIACWGGEDQIHRAVHHLRMEVGAGISTGRLREAVERALRPHGILQAAIRQAPGFRGLRMHHADPGSSITWVAIDGAQALARFTEMPLDPQHGELLRAAVFEAEAGRRTLALAVSALIADRGSLAQLYIDIARACRDEAIESERFQYTQYVAWREELETDEDAPEGHAYWRRYLQSENGWMPPRLVYRLDGVRTPAAQRHCQAAHLDVGTIGDIANAAALAGTTPEVLLQAAWCALLARLSGFNSFAIGWQHDCRRDYEPMQGGVGVFEKVLPVQVEASGEVPFSAWLARMAACADAHIQAQELCALDRTAEDTCHTVGFACNDVQPADAPWHAVDLPGPMPCFELALAADLSGREARLALHADASLYSPQAIERLLSQYLMLLRSVLDKPDTPLSELSLTSASEWAFLQADWCGPNVDFGATNIAQQVAHWAAETPDAPAIVADGRTWSYAAFDAHANRLAHWLRSRGVEAGGLIALALPRSAELVVSMIAAWRIGAGYLPLDPAWPAARKQAVLNDARPALVLGDAQSSGEQLPGLVVMEDIELGAFESKPPAYVPQLEDPAYVLFTSGSTGQPKGVPIEQQHLLNYVAAASAAMELAACRRWGLVASVAADLGNTALFGALFHGACLVIAGADESQDAAAFARFMDAHEIDALKIVPSHLEALLESEAPRLPRLLVLGGEPAPRTLIKKIALLAPGSAVYNHFGPTEATVGVMVHRVALDAELPEVLPLSRVLANNRVYVLDAGMQPVAAGGLGELFIGGAQVCGGYLNRAADGAFVVDPWRPGQRLYRTGDLAWVLPEGGVRLAGRKDHQVKIRGYRVEPAEVEAAMLNAPGVRQAIVLAQEGGSGTELVAFVVGSRGDSGELPAWRDWAAQQLAGHMRPTRYLVLEDFPRLPNGKIDRLALAAVEAVEPASSAGAEPSGPLETVLVRAMADVLKRDRVAADADFFEIGGHSLLVIRLVARVRKLLQIEVEPGLVFDHPTAQALATTIYAMDDRQRLDQLARAHVAAAGHQGI